VKNQHRRYRRDTNAGSMNVLSRFAHMNQGNVISIESTTKINQLCDLSMNQHMLIAQRALTASQRQFAHKGSMRKIIYKCERTR